MSKKIFIRIAAIVVILATVVAFAACGQKELLVRFVDGAGNDLDLAAIMGSAGNNGGSAAPANNGGTPAPVAPADTPATTQAPANNDAPATTQAPANNDAPATTQAPANNDTPAPPADTPATTQAPAAPASTVPTDPAGILAKYKEVMDNTKATIKSYDKLDWIDITEFDVGSASGIIRPIVESLITSKDKAQLQQGRTDHKQIPPVNNVGVGCGLTDASAMASAQCVDNGDGTATITIVMNDEVNPEPMDENTGVSPSKVGGIFQIMSKSQTENTIMENISKVPGGQLNSIDLTYKACTVVMKYDTAANHALTVSYTTPGHADASIKVVFNINAKVCLENHVEISNMVY